jgi:DNA-binding LacI/PurR family transcriptional regulator
MTALSRRPHIGDIAKLAGVSPATVSRVMSGVRPVSEEFRERVLAAAKLFEYQPSQLARNLRRGQTDFVGVIVSDIENPHFATMVRAIEAALYARGKRVLLCNSAEDSDKQASYLDVMAAERVMGVVISPTAGGDSAVTRLMDLGIPTVAFDRPLSDPRADTVTVNNTAAVALGTQLLIDAGRSQIGFVGGRPDVWTADQRLEGYRATMEHACINATHEAGDFTVEGGRIATDVLLQGHPELDGLVVANDQMTVGALQAIRARSRQVPSEIALVAFDDPPWASLVDPPLTTLAQPLWEMAGAAVDRLFDRMNDRQTPVQHIVLECQLRVRSSAPIVASIV